MGEAMMVLETAITDFAKHQMEANKLTPVDQMFVMKSVYSNFQKAVLDEIMLNSIKQSQSAQETEPIKGEE